LEPPVTDKPASEYHIAPLQASHDRSSFHCGVPELDEYFLHQAGQDARRKIAAPFVLLDKDDRPIGYYTLSAYTVRLGELPAAVAKKLPRYPLLPATLLGQLAISQSHRGQNLGQFLLMDALHRSWKNTSEVASIGVVVDAIDDTARSFYLHHEFVSLAEHPKKLFLSMTTIAKAFKAAC
jgi:predicted GNAT family N-acyltransferase